MTILLLPASQGYPRRVLFSELLSAGRHVRITTASLGFSFSACVLAFKKKERTENSKMLFENKI